VVEREKACQKKLIVNTLSFKDMKQKEKKGEQGSSEGGVRCIIFPIARAALVVHRLCDWG